LPSTGFRSQVNYHGWAQGFEQMLPGLRIRDITNDQFRPAIKKIWAARILMDLRMEVINHDHAAKARA
jgi:hypothetical protein